MFTKNPIIKRKTFSLIFWKLQQLPMHNNFIHKLTSLCDIHLMTTKHAIHCNSRPITFKECHMASYIRYSYKQSKETLNENSVILLMLLFARLGDVLHSRLLWDVSRLFWTSSFTPSSILFTSSRPKQGTKMVDGSTGKDDKPRSRLFPMQVSA